MNTYKTEIEKLILRSIIVAGILAILAVRFAMRKKTDVWYDLLDESTRYKGEWKNGLPNGRGIKEFLAEKNKHSTIEGTFVDGEAEGYGKQVFDITTSDEIIAPYYEGEFKNSKQHGTGTYYYGNGSYHTGQYRDGFFNGKGLEYHSQTNKTWIGEYVENKRAGGVWFDGNISENDVINSTEWKFMPYGRAKYMGVWKNGLPNGEGVMEYFEVGKDNAHSILRATFVDGNAEGFGHHVYDKSMDYETTAPYYEGQYKNGKKCGNGVYDFGDGSYYRGEFLDNNFHGKGRYYDSKKKLTWIGVYENDKKKKGEYFYGEVLN